MPLPSRHLASGAFNEVMLINILVLCISVEVVEDSAVLKIDGHC